MKKVIYLSFASVILIMIALASAWLAQIKSSNDAVLALIKQSNIKIEYAYTMRNATRFRQNNILAMYVIDDVFELEEEILAFYKNAKPYRASIEALKLMPMSEDEVKIHKIMEGKTKISYPLNAKIVEMFRDNISKDKISPLLNEVRRKQSELYDSISKFIVLQKGYGDTAYKFSEKQFEKGIFWISVIGVIALIVTLLISHYVSRYVLGKNKQLKELSANMSEAYFKAEQATESKSEFLATMSHEIRTPLTAILGFAETILYSDQNMKQRLTSIHTIIRSSQHLLQIVNDILDLSKVEANELMITYADISIFNVMNEILRIEQFAAEEKGLAFSINYFYPLPAIINIDELRVRQVLLNLCNNAIKFTASGKIDINIKFIRDMDCVSFEVKDTGIGIEKNKIDLVFEAYIQADSSTTRKYGGTGLGLSLSKVLVERMDGTLTADSQYEKGSSFVLMLPCNTPNKELVYKKVMPEQHIESIEVDETKKIHAKILMAEDNIDNQDLFGLYLKRLGVDVDMVDNGKLAVEAMESNNYDLILMDMRMPVMGGIEATQFIRKNGHTIPIIAVTANAMSEDRVLCIDAGCDDFLSKPITAKSLSVMIGKYLNFSEAIDSNTQATSTIKIISILLENDPAIFSLVKKFTDSLPMLIDKIQSLILNMNYKELKVVLYDLKKEAGRYGLIETSELAAKMEFQSLNKSYTELSKLLIELKQQYEKIMLGLQ
ncbi:MAG: ATP-binding protein [Woeseiaceae bacterium]